MARNALKKYAKAAEQKRSTFFTEQLYDTVEKMFITYYYHKSNQDLRKAIQVDEADFEHIYNMTERYIRKELGLGCGGHERTIVEHLNTIAETVFKKVKKV